MLHYYLISNDKINIEILNLEKTNIYLLGGFKSDTHSSIRKIFLLHILLSFLNYMGEKSFYIAKDFDTFLNKNKSIDLEKINVYSNKDSINKNEDIISSDNNNNYLEGNNNNDYLYSKIYEYFLLLPLIKFFILISKTIFVRHNFYNKGALYKNFYIVDLDTGQTLFSLENIYNINNGYYPSKNIQLNKIIWKELLYQGNFLKKNYSKKYGKILDFIDYQQFYIRLEFKSTHPRLIFILRFLPLLNGILLMHEYEMKSYSIEENYDEEYKEIEVFIGNSLAIEEEEEENEGEEDEALLINEPKFIKEREYFFINFFLSTNSNISNIFYIKNTQIKYFSDEVLNVINKTINKYESRLSNSINIEDIIASIDNELYNEYLQINNKTAKTHILISKYKIMYKNKPKGKDIINLELLNEDNNKIITQYQWNYTNLPYKKNLFQIDQKYILIILFNYRKGLKNNQLTLNLSKMDNYSILEKGNIDNNKSNNSAIKIAKDEKLSELLNDDISDYSESIYLNNNNNNFYNDKKNIDKKRLINDTFNKNNKKNTIEENKISDEDKSKDRINSIFDNEKSSIFNLDFTNISKNDIGLYDSFKYKKDKDNPIKKNKENPIYKRKMSEEMNDNRYCKINTFNLKKNSMNILNQKKNDEKIGNMNEKDNTNISFLPNHDLDKSYDEKDKKDLKKKFIDLYYDTISSSEKYYGFQNKKQNENEEK